MGKSRLKLLVIDDDEAAYLMIRRHLSRMPDKDFELDWSSTFDAGLSALTQGKHDACLLDYRLGVRTGLELLQKANSLGVKIPIIILTSNEDPRVDVEATQLGASDFLLKDQITPVLLERTIRYSLQHFATLTALQKSHERFRLLFERSMDAILISNDQGRFVEVNTAACDLLGFSRDKLQQMHWSDLLSNAALKHAIHRPDELDELSFVLPNGEQRTIEFSVSQLAPDLQLSILRDITERRNLEREIQQISEREQRRLGQDLHDGLGQSLTGIAFLCKVLAQRLGTRNIPEAVDADNIAKLINEALLQTRQLSRELCPVVLENNDVESALLQLAENVKTFFGVCCTTKLDSKIKIADNAVAVHLYRIAQEATTNAIKHGKAKRIAIGLFVSGSRLVLRIQDDGIGFPKTAPKQKGMGLRVMQHRARMIGGTLSIRPGKEQGTIVTCSVNKALASKKNGAPKPKTLTADPV